MPDKSIARKLQIKANGTALFISVQGILWLTHHKGTASVSTGINGDGIAAYAKAIGMQAVAQIAVNEDWSALRLKIV